MRLRDIRFLIEKIMLKQTVIEIIVNKLLNALRILHNLRICIKSRKENLNVKLNHGITKQFFISWKKKNQ